MCEAGSEYDRDRARLDEHDHADVDDAHAAAPFHHTHDRAPSTTQPDAPARSGISRGYLIASVATGAVGVGAILGGVWAGSRARSIETEVEGLSTWDPDLHERGQRMDLTAKLLFVGGGAAIVTSGVMLYLGLRHGHDGAPSTALNVVPRAGGASLVWSGSL